MIDLAQQSGPYDIALPYDLNVNRRGIRTPFSG